MVLENFRRSPDRRTAIEARRRSIQKIFVVGTDLSASADLAVRRALMLGEQHGALVVVLHAVPEQGAARLLAERCRRARRLLEDWYGPTGARRSFGLDIRISVGNPATAITQTAAAVNADLLVFGRPRQRLVTWKVGRSTVERAIRNSGIPGLIVNRPPRRPYRKIVLGLTHSATALHAVGKAKELELLDNAEVAVVHAFTLLGKEKMTFSELDAANIEDHLARAACDRRTGMRDFLASCGAAELRRSVHAVQGRPGAVVERMASEFDAELVVIGSPSESPLRRVLCGSTAAEIMGRVQCDVLAVPRPAETGTQCGTAAQGAFGRGSCCASAPASTGPETQMGSGHPIWGSML